MRNLALLAVLLTAGLAAAAGVALNFNATYDLTDCAAGGSGSVTVPGGQYLLTVTDADVFLCNAATCAAGGRKLPTGTVMIVGVGGGFSGSAFSCRSTGSNADVQFTLAN
jgi:hypothetical protein